MIDAQRGLKYTFEESHRKLIEGVFSKTGYELIEPLQSFSGVLGKSRVFLLKCEVDGEISHLIAKFDKPDRHAREWAANKRLLKKKPEHRPKAYEMPITGNTKSHKVIMYSAGAYNESQRVITFQDAFEAFVLEGKEELGSIKSLEKKLVDELYGRPPRKKDPHKTWGQVINPLDVKAFDSIHKRTTELFRNTRMNLSGDHVDFPGIVTGRYRNPVSSIEDMLVKPIGDVDISKNHGDLNLGNIIRSQTSDYDDLLFLIDWSDYKDKGVVYYDLALIEREFWIEFIPDILREIYPNKGMPFHVQLYVSMRREVERLLSAAPPGIEVNRRFGRKISRIIGLAISLRRMIVNIDRSRSSREYCMALFFRYIGAFVCHKTVEEDLHKVYMSFLGASITLESLNFPMDNEGSEKGVNEMVFYQEEDYWASLSDKIKLLVPNMDDEMFKQCVNNISLCEDCLFQKAAFGMNTELSRVVDALEKWVRFEKTVKALRECVGRLKGKYGIHECPDYSDMKYQINKMYKEITTATDDKELRQIMTRKLQIIIGGDYGIEYYAEIENAIWELRNEPQSKINEDIHSMLEELEGQCTARRRYLNRSIASEYGKIYMLEDHPHKTGAEMLARLQRASYLNTNSSPWSRRNRNDT